MSVVNELERKTCGVEPCIYEYVYFVNYYLTPKSKNPCHQVVYRKADDLKFIFDTCAYKTKTIRIEYCKVCRDSEGWIDSI